MAGIGGTLSGIRVMWVTTMLVAAGAVGLAGQEGRAVRLRVLEDSTKIQEIELRDGTKLVGRVVSLDGNEVDVLSLGGIEVVVPRGEVSRVREIRGVEYNGEFWPEDPSDSRLFVGPTARVPRAGGGYVGVYEVVVPSFGVGIGGVAMISGGFSVVPGLDLDEQVFFLSPKVQLFDAGRVQGAVGAVWVNPGDPDAAGGGVIFGGITAGNIAASFSGGIAVPFSTATGVESDAMVLLGGEVRATRRFKLITESWVVPGRGSLLSLGFRIIGSRITVEVAGVTSSEGGPLVPLVNFSTTW